LAQSANRNRLPFPFRKWVLFLSPGHIPAYDERVRGR